MLHIPALLILGVARTPTAPAPSRKSEPVAVAPTPTSTPRPGTSPARARGRISLVLEPVEAPFPRPTAVEFRLLIFNVSPDGEAIIVYPSEAGTGCWRDVAASVTVEVRDAAGHIVPERRQPIVADCRFPPAG